MRKSPKDEAEEINEEEIARTILVREEGILRVGSKKDLRPGDWQYRLTNATGEYTLIDLDHGKAMPLVKSILNDLALFPELRILRIIQYTLFGVSILLVVMGSFAIIRSPTSTQIEEFGQKVKEDTMKLRVDVSPTEQIKQAIQSVNRTGTGAQAR